MKTKCAGYVRVSTTEQAATGLSLQAQRDLIERYAREHDMELVGIYADEGVSAAKSLDKRTGLLKLLADAEQHKFSVFLFKDLTRFSRNAAQYYKVAERLDKCQVGWIAIEQQFLETVTPTGRFMVNTVMGTAQLEADQTAQRIKFTQDAEVNRGYFPFPAHCAPLGYTTKKVNGHNMLVIDEETAPRVREMFAEFLKSGNATQTGEMFGKEHFNLTRTLKNRVYIGEFRGIPNFCEPIINESDFNKAQALMKHNQYRGKVHNYIFSGLAYCGICGAKMVWNCPNDKYPMCRCKRCKNTLTERETERQVLERIEPKLARYTVTLKKRDYSKEKELKKRFEDKLRRLTDLYVDGIISREEFDAKRKEYKTAIESIVIPTIPELPETWQQVYAKLDNQKKNVLWKSVINHIEIKDKKVDICFESTKVLAERMSMLNGKQDIE